MRQGGMKREPFVEVVGHGDAVGGADQKRAGPIPPAALEAPEIAESGARPAIEASLNGQYGSHFGGGERNGNAQEKRNHHQENEAESGAGRGDHGFEREG